jgi:transcriptional regulator with XRE-family HTH domain
VTFREARERAGVSISAITRHSGLSKATVFAVQSGSQRPSYVTAVRLARAVGADPHEIEELASAIRELEEVPA